jgi:hypothetical protein
MRYFSAFCMSNRSRSNRVTVTPDRDMYPPTYTWGGGLHRPHRQPSAYKLSTHNAETIQTASSTARVACPTLIPVVAGVPHTEEPVLAARDTRAERPAQRHARDRPRVPGERCDWLRRYPDLPFPRFYSPHAPEGQLPDASRTPYLVLTLCAAMFLHMQLHRKTSFGAFPKHQLTTVHGVCNTQTSTKWPQLHMESPSAQNGGYHTSPSCDPVTASFPSGLARAAQRIWSDITGLCTTVPRLCTS